MSEQEKKVYHAPDIEVPDTNVTLTNVTVTVEPMTPEDAALFAAHDIVVESKSEGEE